MKTLPRFISLLVALAGISLVTPTFAVVDMEYVTVGNGGNAADLRRDYSRFGGGTAASFFFVFFAACNFPLRSSM